MKRVLYIHGFGSSFDPDSEKIKALSKQFEVIGVNIQYEYHCPSIQTFLKMTIMENNVDLVIGTSLGGWYAAEVASKCGIPFVALNPTTHPNETLKSYVGTNTDYNGREYTLDESIPDEYYPLSKNGYGLILLQEGDDVIDVQKTKEYLERRYSVIVTKGGSHRFDNMEEHLPFITSFLRSAEVSYS